MHVFLLFQYERLRSDLIVCCMTTVLVFGVHVSTAFSSPVLQVSRQDFIKLNDFSIVGLKHSTLCPVALSSHEGRNLRFALTSDQLDLSATYYTKG